MNYNRLFFTIMAVILTVNVTTAFNGGNGTANSPFLISSASDFKQIPNNSNAYYSIVNDISDLTPLNINFKGHLDGQNHTISINTEETNDCNTAKYTCYGIFNSCIGADISNLTIAGNISFVTTYGGYCSESIDWFWTTVWGGITYDLRFCKVKGSIGGICASAQSSTFTNCIIKANVKWVLNSSEFSNTTYEFIGNNCAVGGIVGDAHDCNFKQCVVSGTIYAKFFNTTFKYYSQVERYPDNGTNYLGGIVGYAENCTIENYCCPIKIFEGIQNKG